MMLAYQSDPCHDIFSCVSAMKRTFFFIYFSSFHCYGLVSKDARFHRNTLDNYYYFFFYLTAAAHVLIKGFVRRSLPNFYEFGWRLDVYDYNRTHRTTVIALNKPADVVDDNRWRAQSGRQRLGITSHLFVFFFHPTLRKQILRTIIMPPAGVVRE